MIVHHYVEAHDAEALVAHAQGCVHALFASVRQRVWDATQDHDQDRSRAHLDHACRILEDGEARLAAYMAALDTMMISTGMSPGGRARLCTAQRAHYEDLLELHRTALRDAEELVALRGRALGDVHT